MQLKSWFLNTVFQQKEPEFLREGADSRDRSGKTSDEPGSFYVAINSGSSPHTHKMGMSKGYKYQTEGAL